MSLSLLFVALLNESLVRWAMNSTKNPTKMPLRHSLGWRAGGEVFLGDPLCGKADQPCIMPAAALLAKARD